MTTVPAWASKVATKFGLLGNPPEEIDPPFDPKTLRPRFVTKYLQGLGLTPEAQLAALAEVEGILLKGVAAEVRDPAAMEAVWTYAWGKHNAETKAWLSEVAAAHPAHPA